MNVLGVVRQAFYVVCDAVLPPQGRTARTQARTLGDFPLIPTVHRLLGKDITTIMDYRKPEVLDLIRALKYDGSHAAAALAAGALADYLSEEIANQQQFSTREILLVPVPLHPSRRRERGFNQIELVLQALPIDFRDGTLARLMPEALRRTKATAAQTRQPRRERIVNMRGAFQARHVSALQQTTIFLIDDVATTGSTLKHAGHELERTGARVHLLALARA